MRIEIHHYHHYPEVDKIQEQLSLILKNQKIMADNNKALNDKLDQLQTTVDDVQAQLKTANEQKDALIAELTAAKAALEAELESSVNPEQTAAAIAKIDATIADVASTTATPEA